MAWLGILLSAIAACTLMRTASCQDDELRGYIKGNDLDKKNDTVEAGSGPNCKLDTGKWCWVHPKPEVKKVFDFLSATSIIEKDHRPKTLSKYYYRIHPDKPGYWQLQVVYQSVEEDIFYTRMSFPFKKPDGGPGFWFEEWKFGALDPSNDKPYPKPILRMRHPHRKNPEQMGPDIKQPNVGSDTAREQ